MRAIRPITKPKTAHEMMLPSVPMTISLCTGVYETFRRHQRQQRLCLTATIIASKPPSQPNARARYDTGSENKSRENPMPNMDVWGWVLGSIGAFVAVTALVRLMRRRRDEVLAELTAQAREEQHRKRQAELLEKKKERKRKAAA